MKLTGPCPCGASSDEPNPDCERCELVTLIHWLIVDLYDVRRRRIDDGVAADWIADEYCIINEEVRKIVGLERNDP
jgi:hypothetical protein